MTSEMTDEGAYHVLLIGVDAYDNADPLYGCVTDIDSIQRVLLDRVKIPPSQITRLVSPHPQPERASTVPAEPATRGNIHAALTKLGSDAVAPTDRVFIYYAGHGTRFEVVADKASGFRGDHSRCLEALVPVDAGTDGSNVLFDFELNALIARITNVTRNVTLILDCCHSSGATRGVDAPGTTARFMDFTRGGVTTAKYQLTEAELELVGGPSDSDTRFGSVNDCQVVAACLSHELANEAPRVVPEGQTRSGVLSRSLVEVLEQIPDRELTSAPWGRIWNQMLARIEAATDEPGTPAQHPWMSGGLGRVWLAGPPNDADVGLGIERVPGKPNEYVVDAGTAAGITGGARIAVYGPEPRKFPRFDEPDQQRFSEVLLEVNTASRSHATASAMGEPFDLPAGARGRLIRAGDTERLPCAVVPENDDVVAALAASGLLEVTSAALATARLQQRADGTWALFDDVHGARPDDPPLYTLGADEVVQGARGLMEHYIRYAGPIRMARRCPDLPGALRISLLECPTEHVAPHEFPNLDEVSTEIDGSFALVSGGMFGIRVRNTSTERLKVFLFNSDSTGKVELLGHQPIDGGTNQYFWLNGGTGDAFNIYVPDGKRSCIDRVVAIGTADLDADLGDLVESGTFGSSTRSMGAKPAAAPPWTAAETIVRITVETT